MCAACPHITFHHACVEELDTTEQVARLRSDGTTPIAVRYDHLALAQVCDARVIHQLHAVGYRIPHLRAVLRWFLDPERRREALDNALQVQLTSRSHALLHAAAVLDAVLTTPHIDPDEPHEDVPYTNGQWCEPGSCRRLDRRCEQRIVYRNGFLVRNRPSAGL